MSTPAAAQKIAIKRTKCLAKEYQTATQTCKSEMGFLMEFIIDDTDIGHWWCRLKCINEMSPADYEYRDAEFIIDMYANVDHPTSPPRFFVRTPNGIYIDSTKSTANDYNVCLGVGDRHKEDFECANKNMKGMTGFLKMVLNGLVNWRTLGPGVGILHQDFYWHANGSTSYTNLERQLVTEKRALSRLSREYNLKHFPQLVAKFDELPFHGAISALPSLGLTKANENAVRRHITG